jgi:hypothetical protein
MSIPRTALRALALAGVLSTCSAFAVDAGVAEACKADAATQCPGMVPGDGQFAGCMKEHRDKLSEGCSNAIKKARHHGRHPEEAASGAARGHGHAGGGGGGGEGPDDD